MSYYTILYPEARVVSDKQILTWYSDAVANEQVDDAGSVSAEQAASILHEAGLITLSANRAYCGKVYLRSIH